MFAMRYGVPAAFRCALVSTAKRRGRRATGSGGRAVQPAAAISSGTPAHVPVPMPSWRWKTFPVYFAASAGGFIGLYLGVIVQAAGNSALTYAVFVTFALLLGFGLSRLTTRFLISRNWVKPRPARRR